MENNKGVTPGEPKCSECGSTDVVDSTYPGMAGWASPIYESKCNTCGHSEVEEVIVWDALR